MLDQVARGPLMAAKDAETELLKDSLIREIDEDLRRDRMLRLWKRYRGLLAAAVGLLLVTVAGVQAWSYLKEKRVAEAAAALADADGLAAADPAAALAGFARLADDGPAGYALIARFEEAALRARQGDRAGAIAAYEQAGRQTADPLYRDLATLMALMVTLQAPLAEVDTAAVQAKLTGLAADGSPWRFSARELQAMVALKSGQTGEAERLLQQLRDDAAAPAGIRERAELILSQTGQG
jgi:hypothetical protein